ncbi:meiosis 1 arrest protein-like [Styela clava]
MQRGLSRPAHQQFNLRELYSRQPAHSLIIDTIKPCDLETVQTIVTAVDNFFSLVCSFSGPNRISSISLLASCKRTEMLLPLQKVTKALFPRLRASMDDMIRIIKQQISNPPERDDNSLQHTVREAVNCFSKFKELSSFGNQFEITVLTCRSIQNIKLFADEIMRNLNLSDIKKVEFVSLTKEDSARWSPSLIDDCVSQDVQTTDEGNQVTGFWNVVQLDCNSTSLESYFKNWLKDESTDKEHLQLQIDDVIIKCDMQERLLNPDELPFRSSFCVGSDLYMGTVAQGSRTQVSTPIINIRAKKVVPSEAICESIIFGRPVVLVTSACWQMDWDELETNQNQFMSLCKRLERSQECLICENLTKQQGRHRNYNLNYLDQPKGMFVIIPSNTSSLLLKNICPKELLLPAQIDPCAEECDGPDSSAEKISRALDSVGKSESYNPLEHNSGLCESLKSALLPKAPVGASSRQVSKKPRIQTAASSYRFAR